MIHHRVSFEVALDRSMHVVASKYSYHLQSPLNKLFLTNGFKKRATFAGKGAFYLDHSTATAVTLDIAIWTSTKVRILRMND